MPAPVSGDAYTLAFGKQSAKGTPAANATYKMKVTGGDISPKRTVFQLAETDSSRQAGKNIVTAASIDGSPSWYARPTDFGLWAYAALGANADSGVNPNYTHIATMANSGPYFTIWKNVGAGNVVDKYTDCRCTELHMAGQAGQPITVQTAWQGLSATFGATDDPATVVTEDPLSYPQVTVTKGGSAPGTVEAFSIDIVNNPLVLQADKQINPYDIVWGELMVSGSFTLLFQSDADYRSFHTGSSGGTALGTTLFAESLTILIQVNANLSVQFDVASIAYTEYPLTPDPSGAPIRVAMGWRAQPDPATVGNYCKFTTKNAVATY